MSTEQKLNNHERAIMCLLGVAKDELHGLTILTACRLSRGTVYVTLGRMEDKGLITSRLETLEDTNGIAPRGGIFRRVYSRIDSSASEDTPDPTQEQIDSYVDAFMAAE